MPTRPALLVATLAGVLLALAAAPAASAPQRAVHWRGVSPRSAKGTVCLAVNGSETTWSLLDARVPAVIKVRGPRKVRLVSRGAAAGAETSASWTIVAQLDGRDALRKRLTAAPLAAVAPCRGATGRWSASRAVTLHVPAGEHELRVTAESAPGAAVAARFQRETSRRKAEDQPFAPESYAAVRRLLLESGHQTICYLFSAATPVRFTVTGPVELKIRTRLDFTQTMNGGQAYSLAIERDGKPGGTFHFSAARLDGATYVGVGDVVPGQRKQLRLTVPRGRHQYTLRCVRPDDGGVTVQIVMPRAGLGAGRRTAGGGNAES